jgi:hypothetical protein
MPCQAEHMKPNAREVEYSKVLSCLDEIDHGEDFVRREWWRGYHPSAYSKSITQEELDCATARACDFLKSVDVRQFSLELQLWWRDHLEADQRRLDGRSHAEELQAALAKLTLRERVLLGVTDRQVGLP